MDSDSHNDFSFFCLYFFCFGPLFVLFLFVLLILCLFRIYLGDLFFIHAYRDLVVLIKYSIAC